MYILRGEDYEISEQLLYELVNMVKEGKEPGLTSALVTLHNVLYENSFSFSEEIKIIPDRSLLKIEEQTKYQNWIVSEKKMKEVIRIQRACVCLVWQLSLHCENEELYESIKRWREICNGDKFIEVNC